MEAKEEAFKLNNKCHSNSIWCNHKWTCRIHSSKWCNSQAWWVCNKWELVSLLHFQVMDLKQGH